MVKASPNSMVNTCILTIHYKKITTTDEELTNFKNGLLDLSERIKKSSGIIIEYSAKLPTAAKVVK